MAIGSTSRQPMKTSCLSSVGGSKMPKKVLTRVGKNKNIQQLYYFRSNERFGIILVSLGNHLPVDNIPKPAQMVGTAVLIIEIIGMFPYIKSQ
mgnify:CR=1 FL=1